MIQSSSAIIFIYKVSPYYITTLSKIYSIDCCVMFIKGSQSTLKSNNLGVQYIYIIYIKKYIVKTSVFEIGRGG